jgi:hypothetical protein
MQRFAGSKFSVHEINTHQFLVYCTNLCIWEDSFTAFGHISEIHENSCEAMSTLNYINFISKVIIMCIIFLSMLISQYLYIFPIFWNSSINITTRLISVWLLNYKSFQTLSIFNARLDLYYNKKWWREYL